MTLNLGQKYSRKEISDELGGAWRIYLPNKDDKVFCGCFKLDEEFNPGAPEQVVYGSSKDKSVEKAAEMVYRQGTPIPIFIFCSPAQWKYIGDYRCVGHSRAPNLVKEMMKTYPKRGEIVGVLYFEKA
jgi:hypothetical protein